MDDGWMVEGLGILYWRSGGSKCESLVRWVWGWLGRIGERYKVGQRICVDSSEKGRKIS